VLIKADDLAGFASGKRQKPPLTPEVHYDSRPFGRTKIESTIRYLGIEVDDALAIAEQVDV
jgi:hypothetical protein